MTIHAVEIPGLPGDIRVRKSTRRRRSVEARQEAGITVVTVPNWMSNSEARKQALALHQKIVRKRQLNRRSDDDLLAAAHRLRRKYLPEVPEPSSVRWVTNQNGRWGSCTPTDGSIRLSAKLQDMPQYVVDSVLLHELAHLQVNGHGAEFQALMQRFPDYARASAFLDGVSFAARHPME